LLSEILDGTQLSKFKTKINYKPFGAKNVNGYDGMFLNTQNIMIKTSNNQIYIGFIKNLFNSMPEISS
jgi:hypothetical protein